MSVSRPLPMLHVRLATAAAIAMALGVALGAFGAHGLEDLVSASRLETFETAVRYHLVHGVAVLALAGLLRDARPGWVLLAGAGVFSGSLYLLVVLDASWLGAVAPLGGAGMISGWLWAAWTIASHGRR